MTKKEEITLDELEAKLQRLMRLGYFMQEGNWPPENHMVEVKDGHFISKPKLELLQ